jgi:hypothetical protein
LNGGVGFLISGLEFAGRSVELGGFAMKEAVSQGTADALVKEDEHEGNANAFVGEPVGVGGAVALQQTMGFEFAEVITELGQGVAEPPVSPD